MARHSAWRQPSELALLRALEGVAVDAVLDDLIARRLVVARAGLVRLTPAGQVVAGEAPR